MSGKGSEARLTHGGDPRFRELVRAMDREYGERFGAAVSYTHLRAHET